MAQKKNLNKNSLKKKQSVEKKRPSSSEQKRQRSTANTGAKAKFPDSKQYKTFADIVQQRTAVRHFSPQGMDIREVKELVEIARRSPSGYNLQPYKIVIVRSGEIQRALSQAAFNQGQPIEAPFTVVFLADTKPYSLVADILDIGLKSEHWNQSYSTFIRKMTFLHFFQGPLRIFQYLKWLCIRPLTFIRPVPRIHAGRNGMEAYTFKQTSLVAQTFMLAASAAGYATCPMEGFDPRWLRKALNISARYSPVMMIPIGFPSQDSRPQRSPRLAFDQVVSII